MTTATAGSASPDRGMGRGVERIAAWGMSAACAMHITLAGPITLALLAAVALMPVWLPVALRSKAARAVLVVGLGAVVNGWVLTRLNATVRDSSLSLGLEQTLLVVTLVLGTGALLWARQMIGAPSMALGFGFGLAAATLIRGVNSTNPWKISLSIPVIVICLAIFWQLRLAWVEIIALLALAGISALNDSRSAASILATTALIMVWQKVRALLQLRSTATKAFAAFVGVGLISYNLMQTFIIEGYLGASAQSRSEAQIQAAGSLLLGGRPEIGASLALLFEAPFGYGAGALPTFHDILVAKSGMVSLNYNANNGYVENYMFGTGFEVHSVLADLWIRFGLLGAGLGIVLIIVALRGPVTSWASASATGLTIFLAIQTLWEMSFSPLYVTAAQVLVLAAGLHLKAPEARTPAVEAVPPERTMRI